MNSVATNNDQGIANGVLYNNNNGYNNQKPQFKLKWKTDLDKSTLIQNFEKRGWQKT
jgi:tubulin polyglutamylase TTLL1